MYKCAIICVCFSLFLFACSKTGGKGDVQDKNENVNTSAIITIEDQERIITEVFKVKGLVKAKRPLENGKPMEEGPYIIYNNANTEHFDYVKGTLKYQIEDVVSGAYTDKGRKEILVIVCFTGLSHADGWGSHRFVLYKEDLKTSISEAIEVFGFDVKHFIFKGNKKDSLLVYNHISGTGGYRTSNEVKLYSWNAAGMYLCQNICNTEGTTTYTTNDKFETITKSDVVYPVISESNIVVGKKTYTWNSEKEVFEVN